MPRAHISTALLTLLLAGGCDFGEVRANGGSRGVVVTLELSQDSAGNLDCRMPAVCEDLPYGGDCATVEVDVDTATGRTCQRCVQSDGTTVDQGCGDSVIACVVVTLPDPDCVVCAYVNGAVVFSTCEAEQPDDCIDYYRSDGLPCERCFDPTGRIVFDSCVPDCSDVVCPAVACGPGTQPWRVPGDCCAQCVPIDACEEVVCPTDYPVPDCPVGTGLMRDPVDCCTYVCLPTECPPDESTNFAPPACITHADCPEFTLCVNGLCEYGGDVTGEVCPPGFDWRDDFPYCGQCVEDDRLCLEDDECPPGEICVYEGGACVGSSETGDPATCYGVCRLQDPSCESIPDVDLTLAPCEGEWIIEYDENGCQYPVCLCIDGSVSLDGVCRDQCANVECAQVAPLDCGEDFYLDCFYPYCHGVCVPLDPCAYAAGTTADPPDDAPVWTCGEEQCRPGYHQEIDSTTCCVVCVPDLIGGCIDSYDCPFGQYCTAEDGVCNQPPECSDPSGSTSCVDVCFGECVPYDDLPPTVCEDSDGGIVSGVTGEVLFINADGVASEKRDSCTQDNRGVIEWYCSQGSNGASLEQAVIPCTDNSAGTAASCVDGACVSP